MKSYKICTTIVIAFFIVILYLGILIPFAHSEPILWIVDDAKVLTQAEKQILSWRSSQLQEKTEVTVVIQTALTLSGVDIREFGIAEARRFRIGNKENKGILIVIAMAERKWAIEVGYGLEGIITDYQAYLLGTEYMVPYLIKGQFYNAFANVLNKLAVRLETEKE